MLDIKKVEGYVFDDITHQTLYNLSKNNILDNIEYPISSGKEAITFYSTLKNNPLVCKIYKVETSMFNHMYDYIKGDYRFKRVSKNKRDLFYIWAKKEYKNLNLALEYKVSAPLTIAQSKNILVMSFLGEDGVAYPRLNEVKFDYSIVYDQIIDNYAKMLYGAKIVHADFSAFNILINPNTQKIYVIDFGQAVYKTHPKAQDFLKRDIINIVDFLNKKHKHIDLDYNKFLNDLKEKRKILYG